MHPWFKGFKGSIERIENNRYRVTGIVEKIDDKTIKITELPIREWTENYKEQLEEWLIGTDKSQPRITVFLFTHLKDYKAYHTTTNVNFLITLSESQMREAEKEGLLKRFQLITYISTTNLVCFAPDGRIKKYASPEEILEEFYYIRMKFYQSRREYMLDYLTKEWSKLEDKARFIMEIIDGTLVIQKKKKDVLIKELQDKGYRPFHNNSTDEADSKSNGYDYLLSMPLWNLTHEKVEQILKHKDDAEHQLNCFSSLTTSDLWKIDLDNFMKEFESIKNIKSDDGDLLPMSSKKTKKRVNRKTKNQTDTTLPKTNKSNKLTDNDLDDFKLSNNQSIENNERKTNTNNSLPKKTKDHLKAKVIASESSEDELNVSLMKRINNTSDVISNANKLNKTNDNGIARTKRIRKPQKKVEYIETTSGEEASGANDDTFVLSE